LWENEHFKTIFGVYNVVNFMFQNPLMVRYTYCRLMKTVERTFSKSINGLRACINYVYSNQNGMVKQLFFCHHAVVEVRVEFSKKTKTTNIFEELKMGKKGT
jgi:hypothetical protein